MSDAAKLSITFLIESELRTAAKALHALSDAYEPDSGATEEEKSALHRAAFDACGVALWHAADDDRAIMIAPGDGPGWARARNPKKVRP